MEIYLPVAEMSVNWLIIVALGLGVQCRRDPVGDVGDRREDGARARLDRRQHRNDPPLDAMQRRRRRLAEVVGQQQQRDDDEHHEHGASTSDLFVMQR